MECKMLKNAVVKKAITADEFEEITGEAYTK
ncbi:XkdX family protein [Roseburia sp. AM59-24XD]